MGSVEGGRMRTLKKLSKKPSPKSPPLPQKKYHIIYADPPWEYGDKRKTGKSACGAENHYPCMKLEDIKKLPISDIAEDNCVLYMWVTFPLLKEGLEVIEAWGFKYKTLGFDWTKLNQDGSVWFGIGAYSKSNNEICLMATKGAVGRLIKGESSDPKDKLRPVSNYVSCNVQAPRSVHSRKPEEVRDRIDEIWGEVSKIELFARERFKNWDCWGNEV